MAVGLTLCNILSLLYHMSGRLVREKRYQVDTNSQSNNISEKIDHQQ